MILSFDPTLVEPGFTVQDTDGGIDFIEAWPFLVIAKSPDLDPDSSAEYFAWWLEEKARAVRIAAVRRQFGG